MIDSMHQCPACKKSLLVLTMELGRGLPCPHCRALLRTVPAGTEVAKSIHRPDHVPTPQPPPSGPAAVVPGSPPGNRLIVAAFGMLGVVAAGAFVAGFFLTGHPDPPQPPFEVLRSAPEESERAARFAEEKKQAEVRAAEQAKAVALAQAEAERAEAKRADVERPPEE
jgi:hypothetical protein